MQLLLGIIHGLVSKQVVCMPPLRCVDQRHLLSLNTPEGHLTKTQPGSYSRSCIDSQQLHSLEQGFKVCNKT